MEWVHRKVEKCLTFILPGIRLVLVEDKYPQHIFDDEGSAVLIAEKQYTREICLYRRYDY